MKYLGILLVLSLSALSAISHASPVEISWSNADKYRDLRSVTETRTAFQQRFFKEITQHMNELAQQLPYKFRLTMDVSQVDLAGRIDFINGKQIRVVKDMYYPNMSFSYKLHDDEQRIVLSDDTTIKGKHFLIDAGHMRRNIPFAHEKQMLTDWFKQNIAANVSQNTQH